MKKIILVSATFLFLGFVPHVLAQSFVPLAAIPGLTDVPTNSGGLAIFFNNLYKYLIGLAAVLAIIQITWSGIEIAMNKDDVSKIMDDKGKIYNAIFGLVLVLSPVLIFSIINPNILNLSLNLPALDTKSGGPRAGGGTVTLYPCVPNNNNCDAAEAKCRALGSNAAVSRVVTLNNTIVLAGTPGSDMSIKCTLSAPTITAPIGSAPQDTRRYTCTTANDCSNVMAECLAYNGNKTPLRLESGGKTFLECTPPAS